MAMLESVCRSHARVLNEATQAWAEFEYNRASTAKSAQTPLARWRRARM